MPFSLPNPTVPTNGQSLDATPILANEIALAQAIASFDGSQIQAGSVPSSALATSADPNTLLAATTFPFVASGCVWSAVSGLGGTMSGGTIYYNGIPVTVNSVASHTFTASQDTYVDVDKNGNVTYQGVTNNAASASLTANSIRVAIVVTSGSAITFINLGQPNTGLTGFAPIASSVPYCVQDSLGNLIYPSDPQMKVLGYRQIITNQTTASASYVDITGLSCPVNIPAGRKVNVIAHSGDMQQSTSGTLQALNVFDVTSSVQLNEVASAVISFMSTMRAEQLYLPPSSGARTFKSQYKSDGTHSLLTNAGTTDPIWIRVDLA